MESDLKKHELLKILSKQRQNSKTPVGLPFEEILSEIGIDKDYLDFISGELYGNKEIHFFEDYQYKKGLHATELGVSAYSSEKYKRIHIKGKWILVRNWIAVIVVCFSIPFQIYRHQVSIKTDKTESKQVDYNLDKEKKLQKKGQPQELKQDTLKDIDLKTTD